MSTLPPELTEFADYLFDTYLTPTSMFPPTLWASTETKNRTTNACESFHAAFKKMFLHAHPNIFLFTQVLMETQEETYIKMRSPESKRVNYNTKHSKRHRRIRHVRDDYENGAITLFRYVQLCSNHYRLHFQ